MSATVIIPTYKRPEELKRCLQALQKQTKLAEEIVVVVRESDVETRAFLDKIKADYHNLRIANVSVPGQVAALNAGLAEAKGDIVVFSDDDCVAHPDWLERIEANFQEDAKVGGVGGRDIVYINGLAVSGERLAVGIITWYGRIIGNSHLGFGKAREVDHLKGSNMAFRRKAIENLRFDGQLRGTGAQYRNDLALCLAVKGKGWKIIYDPEIKVDHYYATRFEEDQRGDFNLTAIKDGAYNEMYTFLRYLPPFKRFSCIVYAFFVGSIFLPGLIQYLRILLTGQKQPWKRFWAAMRGRSAAFKYGA